MTTNRVHNGLNPALFVSDALHERKVTLADGSEYAMHFRELPAVSFRAFQIAEQSADEEVRASSMARLVAASVCNPDGTPAMTLEKAKTLKPGVMNAMVVQIMEINALGTKEKNG